MPHIITYTNCPCCNSNFIQPVLKAIDNTVSHEQFEIWQCRNCSLRFTQNVPAEDSISSYYQSADYVSHSDTKKGLINRLYHIVRNHTLQTKRTLIQKTSAVKNGSLLDVGAGTGAFVNIMQKAGWNVTGLEPDATARKNALQQYNIQLQTLQALSALPPGSFNVITLWHVLEHVHQLHHYINIFHTLLKNNGTLIIAVPNYTGYDAELYQQNWAAYDVPRHLYHFSPASMQILLQQHGFTITKYEPMWFDSFYISMLSQKNLTGKSNVPKAFYNGLQSNFKAFSDAKKCSSVIYIIHKV